MNYEECMQKALDAARNGMEYGEMPFGAVLCSNGKILSIAHNEVVSSQNELNHAEVVAINKYLKSSPSNIPNDLTLVTTCEPCVKCIAAALKLGVKKFVYGTSLSNAIKYGTNDINIGLKDLQGSFNYEIVPGVLENKCNKLLEIYNLKRNIVSYSKGTEEEQKWMKEALEVGRRGMYEDKELPIGIVVVADNKILSKSNTKTYTSNSPILHGDFAALLKAERQVYDLNTPIVLYSSLEPHLIGFSAAIKCHLPKVVFGLEAPDGGACYIPHMVGVNEMMPKVVGGVLRDDEYLLMREFLDINKNNQNRVGYGYAKKLVRLYDEKKRME